MSGPLAGIRIVDLTLALAGPAATQRLADWGADVIKVEPPVTGEWGRTHPIRNAFIDGEATSFIGFNRNKRSIAIDLKNPVGQELVLRLAEAADVFCHNFRPGVIERLGLAPGVVRARNPRLVYGFVTGYGSRGPDSRRPGQDLLLQAYSGVMFSVGSGADRPNAGPIFAADVLASHFLAEGVMAALIERARTGAGQVVEVSMLGAMLDAQMQELITFLNLGIGMERPPYPAAHAMLNPPYGVYQTRDGWIAIAMADPVSLGEAIGSEAVKALGTWEAAAENGRLIHEEVTRALPARGSSEWIELLDAHGVWCGPVHRYDDLPGNEHIRAEGYFRRLPLAGGGTFTCPDGAVDFPAHEPAYTHPPRVSEHADEILDELGLVPAERARFEESGCIWRRDDARA
ncbi:MAG: CoA transferase [Thermoleophilia bacterium]|nr:CoA transferase [Thermoleophilia bacterium]